MTLALALAPLAHLVGDYVLQSHTMATRKTASWRWAWTHAVFYSLPFLALLLATAPAAHVAPALVVIGGTHAVIDRLGIAGMWCRWYGVGHPGIWHREERDGAFVAPPQHIGQWLTIIVDNTLHMAINAAALAWTCS
jgi:hypothetical protein